MKGFLQGTKGLLSKINFFVGLLATSFSVYATLPVFFQASQFEWSANVGLSWLQTGNSTVMITDIEIDRLRQTRNPLGGELGLGVAYLEYIGISIFIRQ